MHKTDSKHRQRRAEHDASTHWHPNDEPERSAAVAHGTYNVSWRDLQVALVKLQRHLIQCQAKIVVLLEGRRGKKHARVQPDHNVAFAFTPDCIAAGRLAR